MLGFWIENRYLMPANEALLCDLYLSEVSEFKSLKILDLSNNHVEGKIPEGVGSLGNLEVLNLGNNLLSGSVPNVLVMVVCELSSQMFSFKGDVDSEELEPTLDTILEFLLSLVMM
ncbi:probably inactive leucine-rich repeat receptor-like protein kinase, partial [Tanacetum coccineum]